MVKFSRFNSKIFTIFLDFNKAYNSLPRDCIIISLDLTKMPNNIIQTIKEIITLWAANIHLNTSTEQINVDKITYKRGMMQGDSLSVILFILSFNPLSYLLRKSEGYTIGKPGERNTKITHLAFVDDFKLISNKIDNGKQQLDIVTKYSNDIGMSFGEDKCAYMNIKKGKRHSIGESITLNGVKIRELKEEETYKYLGLHESVISRIDTNKVSVTKEYNRRLRKIWKSELNAHNKVIATNSFAVPIITYTIGLLDWTNEEIKKLDIQTRKVMNINNSLHRRSDIDRIYLKRLKGGRGLRNIEDEFLSKSVAITQHLITIKEKSEFVRCVVEHETNNLVKLDCLIRKDLDIEINVIDKSYSDIVKNKLQVIKEKNWVNKSVHGYFPKTLKRIESEIDKNKTWKWLQSNTLTSQVESYIVSLQDQEVNTREARKRHERDVIKKQSMNSRCRLCMNSEENLQHILGVCPSISTNLYLNARHNPVAEVIYYEIFESNDTEFQIKNQQNVYIFNHFEIWWDQKITTAIPVAHNKPDIVVWNNQDKLCQIIDISVPLDMNVGKKVTEKINHYMGLVTELQRVYRQYKFSVIPIVVGCLGCIPNSLEKNIKDIGIKNDIIGRLQKTAILGSLKIVKTFLKMRDM